MRRGHIRQDHRGRDARSRTGRGGAGRKLPWPHAACGHPRTPPCLPSVAIRRPILFVVTTAQHIYHMHRFSRPPPPSSSPRQLRLRRPRRGAGKCRVRGPAATLFRRRRSHRIVRRPRGQQTAPDRRQTKPCGRHSSRRGAPRSVPPSPVAVRPPPRPHRQSAPENRGTKETALTAHLATRAGMDGARRR
jgi:hypothetical protein